MKSDKFTTCKNLTIFIVGVCPDCNNINWGNIFGHYNGHDTEFGLRRGSANKSITARISGDTQWITEDTKLNDSPFILSMTLQSQGPNTFDHISPRYFSLNKDSPNQSVTRFQTNLRIPTNSGPSKLTNTTTAPIYIGQNETGGEPSQIIFNEIIYYKEVLSTDHIYEIEGYLAWKWGLENALDPGHIYKNASPMRELFESAAIASAAIASSAVASSAIASADMVSSAIASAAIASAAYASGQKVSAAIASGQMFSAAYASGQEASGQYASGQQASAAYASGQQASGQQYSAAYASGQQASGQQYSGAYASGQQASAAYASGQQASAAYASGQIASAAYAYQQQNSAAYAADQIASAAVASGQMVSAAYASGQKASGQQASGQQYSAAYASGQQASGQQYSGAYASGQQASGQQYSGAYASGQQASAAYASGQQASGQQYSGAYASGQQASGQQYSGAYASGQQYSGAYASGQQASGQQYSGAYASGQQASAAYASGQQASAAYASGQQASAAYVSGQQASGQQYSAARASSAIYITNDMDAKIKAVNADIDAKKAATTDPLVLAKLEMQRLALIDDIKDKSGINTIGESIEDINNLYDSKMVGIIDPVKLAAIQTERIAALAAQQKKQDDIVKTRKLQASAAQAGVKLNLIRMGYNPPNGEFITGIADITEDVLSGGGSSNDSSSFILNNNLMDQTVKTNNFSARYIRILPPVDAGDGWLNLSQIIVNDPIGNVISKGKLVYSTSTMVGTADASTLTNGDTTPKSFPDLWSTEYGSRNTDFVEIDLEQKQPIGSIRLLGRNDCGSEQWCMDRMLYVRIELLNTTTNEALTYYSINNPQTIANTKESAAHAVSDMEASAAQAFSRFGNDPKNGKFILMTNEKEQLVLTNQVLGRYIRIRPSTTKGDGFINISQIIVYDILGLNIATGRPVFATSSHPQTSPASCIVDGSTQPNKFPNFWHSNTPDRDNEYIEIDLGSLQYITGVKVLGIQSCPPILGSCNDRMLELRVEINKETTGAAMEKFATILNYISLCGSSNSSNTISFIRAENNIPIRRIDPSLPKGYMRYWNKQCRGYVYHDSENQIVMHPLGPKMRTYSDRIQRVPNIKVPTRAYAMKLYAKPPMSGGADVSAAQGLSNVASAAIASAATASGQQAYADQVFAGQQNIASAARAVRLESAAIASGQIASGQIAAWNIASGQIASGQMASAATASGQLASEQMASAAVASGQIASGQIVLEKNVSAANFVKAQASAAVASAAQAVYDVESSAKVEEAIASSAIASSAQASAAIYSSARAYEAEVSAANASTAIASSAVSSSAKASAAIALTFKPGPMDIEVPMDITLPPPWIKYFDTKIRKYFYVQPVSYKEQWEHPVVPPKPTTQSYNDKSLPAPWKKYLDPTKNIFYYYDTSTTETTWDHPYPPPYPENINQIEVKNLSPLYKKFKS
ncbi:MAG: hypothetical protein EBU66_16320, partial [Bacteroidetes bacterium]|nr:hypothetical protein [Bacteroidota bacterium]